ncbi:MAG: succinate dehydrogenase assembly factor 2 [Alphaproteobacteria bacterium]|nr:succinate dehydrogenase assembly factor 2 [Alphaproteobacteria bacterium]
MSDANRQAERRGRLRFRSWHRGTREMDLLMGSFADAHIGTFTPAQLGLYEAVLELSDPDLYNWIAGIEPLPPENDNEVMQMLCAHRFAKPD